MTTVEAFVRKHPVLVYFVLTFTISWGAALLAIGRSGAMQGTTPTSDPRFAYALVGMLAGPTVTGVLLTAIIHGRAGLRSLVSRLFTARVGARWYAVALFTAPTLMCATLFALSLTSRAFWPGILTSDNKMSLLLVGLGVGFAAGIFEETGWTGFAIPTWRRRHGIVATGVFVGIWWSAWHLLPNIWSSRAAAGELAMSVHLTAAAIGVLVGYLTAFRVLMVWVYDRTESLFVAMLMHSSFTASLLILNPLEIAGAQLVTFSFTLAAVLWVVVAAIAVSNSSQLSRPPLRRRVA